MDAEQYDFQAISEKDGTWAALTASWKRECEAAGEDFATYAELTIETILPLVRSEQTKAWVFALKVNDRFPALCQVNRALLPGYDGPVLRVRFITLSPEYDLTEKTASDYGRVLVHILASVLKLALVSKYEAKHVKFHLASPADQQFFQALRAGLQGAEPFETVESHGAWLYISSFDNGTLIRVGDSYGSWDRRRHCEMSDKIDQAVARAVGSAIAAVGLDGLRKTSIFMSNRRPQVMSKAA